MIDLIQVNLFIAFQPSIIIKDWLFVSDYVIAFHIRQLSYNGIIFFSEKESKGENNSSVTLIIPAHHPLV
jgi:hypothetical protein